MTPLESGASLLNHVLDRKNNNDWKRRETILVFSPEYYREHLLREDQKRCFEKAKHIKLNDLTEKDLKWVEQHYHLSEKKVHFLHRLNLIIKDTNGHLVLRSPELKTMRTACILAVADIIIFCIGMYIINTVLQNTDGGRIIGAFLLSGIMVFFTMNVLYDQLCKRKAISVISKAGQTM